MKEGKLLSPITLKLRHGLLLKNNTQNTKLENFMSCWYTCFLVLKIPVDSRQIKLGTEKKSRCKNTRIDDERESYFNPEEKTLKRTISRNARPKTCLFMVWNILTALIKEEIYYMLINDGLFAEGQKECRKGIRVRDGQQYIDQQIFMKVIIRQKYSRGIDCLKKLEI